MRLLKIVVFLFLSLSMFGCHGEPRTRFKKRHKIFMSMLTKQEIELYNKRLYAKAGELLSKRIKSNKDLKVKFDKMKKNESIEFFSVEKVFVFFGDTIKRQIAFYDFTDYLSPEEEVMFQKMQFKDLVYSVAQKNRDPIQKAKYDDILKFGNLTKLSDIIVVKFLRDTNTVYKRKYSYDKLVK